MRKKLAIVGFSPKSRDLAPIDDPEWEIWGCNHIFRYVPRLDVLYEIHRIPELEAKYGPERWKVYSDFLKSTDAKVYMMDTHPEYPNVHKLPVDELVAEFGWLSETVDLDYDKGTIIGRSVHHEAQFKSTLSYMMCMAIRENRFETIAVYGVDMAVDSEWHYQRMNFSFFLGWARGAGVNIILPDTSALLREEGWRLYGYETGTAAQYKDLITELGKEVQVYDALLRNMDRENSYMVDRISQLRGAISLAGQFEKNEAFNGHTSVITTKRESMSSELNDLLEKQSIHLAQMHGKQGERNKSYSLMEKLGYHHRGEMPNRERKN